ncbi:glycoside hydrolase family 3 protein [Mesobacillus maritimus]|uniref:glycoside hydrolase family 3 protein n=1 Tax=Mesobacillus maritimus TaxID=1643336 RepID=UPI00203AD41A|nr:glycoside hydrolase family 3 protein [Mesobacillus maritimus]MCM3585335.1 glycoside hydrolase family 3 protein [Mesobacillus maritimus]
MLKKMVVMVLTAVLVLSGIPAASLAASQKEQAMDLILDANIPEVTREVENNKLVLHPLHVYKDGSYKLAGKNLVWKSSNKKVADISNDGTVTLTGQNGAAVISVSDGRYEDRIRIQSSKGGKTKLIKPKAKRYDLIGKVISKMTMEEKVGQMLMPDFRNWEGKNVTEMNSEIAQLVKNYHLGGVILFRENTVTTAQTTKLVHDYQQAAEKFGLLISIDQEGGIVTRLQMGTDFPGNMALGASRSEEMAEKVGKAIGEELNALGINMNFGPVLDVNNNPDNPVIGVRSFGEDPQLVADLGKAYIKGLHESGIAATSKHFPGHGDTAVDSHIGLPSVPHDIDRLKQVELYPFQQAMGDGMDAIMSAHVTFPKIDDTKAISKKDGSEIAIPGTLSKKVLTGLVREEMGYEGVIVTDAMNMAAISDHFGPVDAAIRAVNAGADILLMPVGIEEVANGIYDAIHSGDLSVKRIEQSVKRVLALKMNRGIFKAEEEVSIEDKIAHAQAIVGSAEHKNIEKEAAEKSITLVKNEELLPLNPEGDETVLVIGSGANLLAEEVRKHHEKVEVIATEVPLSALQLDRVKDADYVVLGTQTSSVSGRSPNSNLMKLANQVIAADVPVAAVGIRNPYDIMAYPQVEAYIAQYSFRPGSYEASINAIFGKNNPSGQLPVTIYSQEGSILYNYGHGLSYE